MPKYEILHSGEYWQTLRRAKAEREARRAAQPRPDYVPDGGLIFTFVPGRAEPVTSTLHPNGSLIPIPGLPVASSTARAPAAIMRARPKPRNGRSTNSFAAVATARATQEDAVLLARLKESLLAREIRKQKEEQRKLARAGKAALRRFVARKDPGRLIWGGGDTGGNGRRLPRRMGQLEERGREGFVSLSSRRHQRKRDHRWWRTGEALHRGRGVFASRVRRRSNEMWRDAKIFIPPALAPWSPIVRLPTPGGVILEGGAGGAQLDICLAWRLRRQGGIDGRRSPVGTVAPGRVGGQVVERLAPVAHVVIPAGGIAPGQDRH
ncbi:hypothetical protein B0H13DRAFT_1909113 [Mycena leptocephala]|nr:hypothetical protein B0H13DRAFT_1909113 [Mycena leptocephala]